MPPLKYRRPVEKKHKESLEAFSFAQAWRRKSHQSVYSPMGSRMPSRAASVVTGPSRSGSVTTAGEKSLKRGGSLDVSPDDTGADREAVDDMLNGASSSLESFRF